MRKYQPSNGTEGSFFIEEYCMNCLHCDPDPSGKKQCEILCATMVYDIKDKEYPMEWIYDENDSPCCTKWQKWDWGNDGEPDDDNNPKAPIPVAPNQLMLFSVADEILQNSDVKQESSACV